MLNPSQPEVDPKVLPESPKLACVETYSKEDNRVERIAHDISLGLSTPDELEFGRKKNRDPQKIKPSKKGKEKPAARQKLSTGSFATRATFGDLQLSKVSVVSRSIDSALGKVFETSLSKHSPFVYEMNEEEINLLVKGTIPDTLPRRNTIVFTNKDINTVKTLLAQSATADLSALLQRETDMGLLTIDWKAKSMKIGLVSMKMSANLDSTNTAGVYDAYAGVTNAANATLKANNIAKLSFHTIFCALSLDCCKEATARCIPKKRRDDATERSCMAGAAFFELIGYPRDLMHKIINSKTLSTYQIESQKKFLELVLGSPKVQMNIANDPQSFVAHLSEEARNSVLKELIRLNPEMAKQYCG